ncbi:MAG TPA: N-acetyltransferase [Fimbriimonadaceae bacterium]|nr:N-acetyltransferase [Fimbriimonadaceae bacterium]
MAVHPQDFCEPMLVPAGPDDRAFAFEVLRQAFGPYVEVQFGWVEEDQQRLHRERYRQEDNRIIQFEGERVGILASGVRDGALTVFQLFILPAWQGRGIGPRVMDMVFQEASDLGLPVALGVMKVNPRAKAFWERLGFVVCEEKETHYLMRRETLNP